MDVVVRLRNKLAKDSDAECHNKILKRR